MSSDELPTAILEDLVAARAQRGLDTAAAVVSREFYMRLKAELWGKCHMSLPNQGPIRVVGCSGPFDVYPIDSCMEVK